MDRPTPSPSDTQDAAVRSTVHALFEAWIDQTPGGIDRFLTYVADDITGIGPAPGELWDGPASLRAMIERERASLPFPFTLAVTRLAVRFLRDGLALAEGDLTVEVRTADGTFSETPRYSFVLDRREGRWILRHIHFSVADALQEEGSTMRDILDARTRELEQEVARRTAELKQSLADLQAAQARLIQAEKLASLGQLTAGIAHEIKNPLNFVTNFAALSRELVDDLEAETDPAEARELLAHLKTNAAKIEEHGRRADGIVRAMMDHARGETGTRQPTDLNKLVASYIDLAYHGRRAQDSTFQVALETDLDGAVGEVVVAPQALGRVLLNLLTNAFDAVHTHTAAQDDAVAPTVRVATRRVGDQVELRVEDNGPGVPKAVRDRIFEPFFTTKPPGSGTGLGLSLSYDIITQGHGGTLMVGGGEGQGAVFVVRLPVT